MERKGPRQDDAAYGCAQMDLAGKNVIIQGCTSLNLHHGGAGNSQ